MIKDDDIRLTQVTVESPSDRCQSAFFVVCVCFGGNFSCDFLSQSHMENPEEILHSLEEFAKMKPKDIPRELEEYLKFVAKTGDPVYQWSAIKSLFREKLVNVITEFYESCSGMEIPLCPNVDLFNYDLMKNFILEKLDTFAAAPFTLQRICELLTSPRKEYTRIDKYMRALEKNILVVSTMEPGGRRTENGESIMNGIESDHEHVPELGSEINVEEIDETPFVQESSNHVMALVIFDSAKNGTHIEVESTVDTFTSEKVSLDASTTTSIATTQQEVVCNEYVSIEPVSTDSDAQVEATTDNADKDKEWDTSVTITAATPASSEKEDDEPVQSTDETDEVDSSAASEATATTTTEDLDKPESSQDSLSPENSITSSDTCESTAVEARAANNIMEAATTTEVVEETAPIIEVKADDSKLDDKEVDSTTKASGDTSDNNETPLVVVNTDEESTEVQSSESDEKVVVAAEAKDDDTNEQVSSHSDSMEVDAVVEEADLKEKETPMEVTQ